MAEFFVEILSEEVPARMQRQALAQFTMALETKLKEAGLCSAPAADSFVTPRRMAVHFLDVAALQPDRREEKRGPRVGAPQAAVDGFLKGAGLNSLDQAEQRSLPNGEFWFAVTEQRGQAASAVLPGLVLEAMRAIAWPKSMRWATGKASWVRPLHGIVAIFDGKPLDGFFDFGDGVAIAFSNSTVGHRFLAPEAFEVSNWSGYRAALKSAYVMLDQEERRRLIVEGATELAASVGLKLRADPGLIDEIVGLVEWPIPLMGRIDDAFMDLPAEVLTTSMRVNQRYIALETADGALAPQFVTIANLPTPDGGKVIVAGNERVLRARLADARFFWDLDRQTRLETFAEKLDQRIFHAKLGTVSKRVARLRALAREIAPTVCQASQALEYQDLAGRAALLCKADLSSGMVGEFPELQGVMGRYYAHIQKEPPEVADAIAEHYAPLGPNDQVPTKPVSVALALADKLDMLASFFSIGEKPTGSRDPFALRRAALGVIRIVLESGKSIHLSDHLQFAVEQLSASRNANLSANQVKSSVWEFIKDRLKVYLKDKGYRHDIVQSVIQDDADFDIYWIESKIIELTKFLKSSDGEDAIKGYRRVANFLGAEKTEDLISKGFNPDLIKESAEIFLRDSIINCAETIESLEVKLGFFDQLLVLSTLRVPIDRFFTDLKVNADEPNVRLNRLAMLAQIVELFDAVADFSAIEG
jgi:glycyl-tRNA synthetase beta chain